MTGNVWILFAAQTLGQFTTNPGWYAWGSAAIYVGFICTIPQEIFCHRSYKFWGIDVGMWDYYIYMRSISKAQPAKTSVSWVSCNSWYVCVFDSLNVHHMSIIIFYGVQHAWRWRMHLTGFQAVINDVLAIFDSMKSLHHQSDPAACISQAWARIPSPHCCGLVHPVLLAWWSPSENHSCYWCGWS